MWQKPITKYVWIFITKCGDFIAKSDSYSKIMRRLLPKASEQTSLVVIFDETYTRKKESSVIY